MNDILNWALSMISNNPQIASNPANQAMINAIRTGDEAKGKQIAMNICQSYGMTPQQAMQQAMQGLIGGRR